MDFQSLSLFLHLSQELHFGRTSEQNHISPSALSRLIQRMENELGYSLFVRDNRSVVLTTQGLLLAEFATRALQDWQQFKTNLGQTEGRLTGNIRIFASVTASQTILPGVLSRFRESYPEVQIELETGYAVDAMTELKTRSDVVVAALSLQEEELLEKAIVRSIPILTVYPRAGVVAELMSEGESGLPIPWRNVPLILPTIGQARDNIDQWIGRLNISPTVYSEVAGNEAVLTLVALGCGVGFVPQLVLDNSPLRSQVNVSNHGPQLADFHVGFCTYQKNLKANPIIEAFWSSIPLPPGP